MDNTNKIKNFCLYATYSYFLIQQEVDVINEAVRYLKNEGLKPDVFVVLGSGLGDMVEEIVQKRVDIPFDEIPGFPGLTVKGHRGAISYVETGKTNFMLYRGRKHLYEGEGAESVVFAHRVAVELGAKKGILTCSAGSVNTQFRVGDIVQVTDYIDMQFVMPAPGFRTKRNLDHSTEDMTEIAREFDITLRKGVLMGLLGPTYETDAEVEMIRELGGDLASMSTAPEINALKQMGIPWLSFAVVTNIAGLMHEASHEEVLIEAGKASIKLLKMILSL